MTWPSRFLAVPTSALTLGKERIAPTHKATPSQLAEYAAAVPEVYRRLAKGFTELDFREMQSKPLTEHERIVGDAYIHMYSPQGRDSRLEAEFLDGVGLVVTRGRHRFMAANQIGVPYLPVHVRASNQRSLDVITAQLENEISRIAPEVVLQQRVLDHKHYCFREKLNIGREISPNFREERSVERKKD